MKVILFGYFNLIKIIIFKNGVPKLNTASVKISNYLQKCNQTQSHFNI